MFNITGGEAWGYSVSPGILLHPTQNIAVGLVANELLNSQKWGTYTVETGPMKISVGTVFKLSHIGLILSSDIEQSIKGGYAPLISLGTEWTYRSVAFRLGKVDGTFSGGIGFKIDKVSIDYAYVTQPALSRDNVHRLSLTGWW